MANMLGNKSNGSSIGKENKGYIVFSITMIVDKNRLNSQVFCSAQGVGGVWKGYSD